MNMQEAFFKAASGMLRQGRKSEMPMPGDLQCAYRGDGGAKCAIGHLMSDEYYRTKFDDLAYTLANDGSEEVCDALEASGISFAEPRMLSMLLALQEVHDCYEVQNWPVALRELAATFGLDASGLPDLEAPQ